MKIDVGNGIDFIGDIHACYDEFIELLNKLNYQPNKYGLYIHPHGRKIVSLGDVMSRGPQSIKCMQFFLSHVNAGLAYMIDSNHGWKIARWLMGRNVQLRHGDEKVEEEFREYEKLNGVKETAKLKEDIKELLINSPSHYIFTVNGENQVVCAHAGIRDDFIGKENNRIKNFCRYGDVSRMDERGKPIRKDWYKFHEGNLLIIWGHDPKREPLIENNTINIDQGAVFGGKLTCFRYPENEFVFVKASKNYSGKVGEDNPIHR
ncbi:metallophosphoesterase [Ureibacillus xyleni]|uniref:metallophosphoesterase n=1 Tax=Ureibacillus xyleni TaxID=614648 RepID=UPI000BE47FAF|nr:metallophosphoesterase [Ureibacillus xyleni]